MRVAFDAILAMYHDQGLPVLKAASFGHGVNVTLGLPFVRTSVDHGTALDLAGDAGARRTADAGSLWTAVELAIALAPAPPMTRARVPASPLSTPAPLVSVVVRSMGRPSSRSPCARSPGRTIRHSR